MNGNFTAKIGARITDFMAKMKKVQNTIKKSANDVRVDIGADIAKFKRKAAEVKARMLALAREKVIVKIEARIEEFQNKINRIATNIRAFGELMQHTLMGSMMAVFPAIVPLIANLGVAIANLGPMIGTVAGSTFALAGAFGVAGAAVGAFAAVAIPTIKDLFEETGPPFTELQLEAHNAKEAVVKSYNDLVKKTEAPVLKSFAAAMQITNKLLKQLEPLFIASAKAVESLMSSLNQAIDTPPVQKFLEYLNTSGGPMLETFGRAFGNVFQGIISMLTAFAPLSASTAKGFEDMTARFAEWANGLSDSAKFQAFMDYVNTNMPKIRAIFRDATAGLVYFFSAFGGSASGMMDGLVDMMARFKEWSKTLSENQGFQQFLSYVSQTAPSIITLIGNLAKFLVNLGVGMAPLGAKIIEIVNKILEFANSAMEGNSSIGVIIAGFVSFGGMLLALVPNIIAFGTLFSGLGSLISKGLGGAFKIISPLFKDFRGVISKIVPKLKLVGKAFGFITSPAGLIVGAIIGLIAIFVRLYQTNDTFRAQVQQVWEIIKTAISIAINAVKDLVMSVWTQITSFWNENQESIKATAATIWDFIGNVVTTAMSVIGSIMQFVWPVVKALIVSTWNAIKNVIQGAIDIILGIVKTFSSLFQGDWRGVWEGIKQILGGALQAAWGVINLYFVGKLLGPLKAFGGTAKKLIQSAWTAIKGVFTNTLNAIKTFVTTIFNGIKTAISNVMNNIKSTISSIWNSIKSTIRTILNGIKTFISNLWNAIKTTISNTLNSIKSIFSSVWNIIKSIVRTVLNGIKIIVTTVWNGIKSFISTVLSGIKTVVTSMWNAIKTVVSTTMNGVKKAITDGWNAAKSFLSNINLVDIGKNIIKGLINGIGSMFGNVKSKVSELANMIPQWAKDILGIHSPSRVMIALAKWIPIGVAKGIESTTGTVSQATNQMAKKAIPDFTQTIKTTKTTMANIDSLAKNASKTTNADVLRIQKEYDKKRSELERKSNQQFATIRASASKKTQTLTKAQQQRINNIVADGKAQREKLAKQEADAIAKVTSKSQAKMLSSMEQYVENKESLELWSTEKQAEYWQYATTLFKANTKERIQAQKHYNKATEQLAKEKFEKEKDFIDRTQKYGKLSLAQELAAYQKYVKDYKKGSEERIYYEDKIAETKQAIHEKLMSINDEYISKIADAQQKEADGIKELQKVYDDAVANRSRDIYSWKNLFDEIGEKAQVTSQQLIKNLQDQVSVMGNWAHNIKALASRGIDKGLLAELQAMGPSAYAEIEALNSMTEAELSYYNELWRDKTAKARIQAEAELVDLKESTNKQIEALRNDTKNQLETYKSEWLDQIKAIKTGTVNEFNPMISTMKQIGTNVIQGLQNGMKTQVPSMLKDVRGMARDVEKAIRDTLSIHSPSRVADKLGVYFGQGFTNGIASMRADAANAAASLADAARADLSILTDGLSAKSAISSAQNTNITSESILDLSMFDKVVQLLRIIADKDLSLELDGRLLTNYLDESSARKKDLKRSMRG